MDSLDQLPHGFKRDLKAIIEPLRAKEIHKNILVGIFGLTMNTSNYFRLLPQNKQMPWCGCPDDFFNEEKFKDWRQAAILEHENAIGFLLGYFLEEVRPFMQNFHYEYKSFYMYGIEVTDTGPAPSYQCGITLWCLVDFLSTDDLIKFKLTAKSPIPITIEQTMEFAHDRIAYAPEFALFNPSNLMLRDYFRSKDYNQQDLGNLIK